jgi:ABC-type transport system involved in cytochrome c biogenesis permease subunit
VPLPVGGALPAPAVAEARASTPGPFRAAATHIAEAVVAEAAAAVPMMIVPMRKTVIVPVLKSIAPIIAMPVLIVQIGALSFSAVVASHGGAMHRKAAHPTAMAAPCAAAMRAAAAARQRTRVAEQHASEADDGDDHQCSCRHRSTIRSDGNANSGQIQISTALSPPEGVIAIAESIKKRTIVKTLSHRLIWICRNYRRALALLPKVIDFCAIPRRASRRRTGRSIERQ